MEFQTMPLLSKCIIASFIVFLFNGFSVQAQSLMLQCVAPEGQATEITQSNQKILLLGDCGHVIVSGDNNEYLSGNLAQLEVSGDNGKYMIPKVE